jgi:hypothetical protein
MSTRKNTTAKKPASKKPGKRSASPAPLATNISAAPKMSQLQAAIAVLKKSRKPMNCQQMVEAMAAQNLWTSPGGKTPHATLCASILRDLGRGSDSNFKKVDRGQFTLSGK